MNVSHSLFLFSLLFLFLGCPTPDYGDEGCDDDDDVVEGTDDDGDHWTVEDGDCDDGDPLSHPGAVELCDGVDNDCDGELDEEAADEQTWYTDSDGDGFGDPDAPVTACEAPGGMVADDTDCDDTDANAFPGGSETPDDGVDQDCDGADAISVEYGHRSLQGTTAIAGDDYLLGMPLDVDSDFTLSHFGLRVAGAAGNGRMALYADLDGVPGTLVASSAASSLVQGENLLLAEAAALVAAGAYWVAAVYDQTTHIDGAGIYSPAYIDHDFSAALPDPFGVAETYEGSGLSYWVSGIE